MYYAWIPLLMHANHLCENIFIIKKYFQPIKKYHKNYEQIFAYRFWNVDQFVTELDVVLHNGN